MMAVRSNHRKNSAAGKCHLTSVYDYLAQFISLRSRRGRHWEDRSGQIEAHWGGGETGKQRVCETLNNYQQPDGDHDKVLKFWTCRKYAKNCVNSRERFLTDQDTNIKSFCQLKDKIQLWKALQLLQLKSLSPLFTTFPWVRVGNMIFQLFVAVGSERK